MNKSVYLNIKHIAQTYCVSLITLLAFMPQTTFSHSNEPPDSIRKSHSVGMLYMRQMIDNHKYNAEMIISAFPSMFGAVKTITEDRNHLIFTVINTKEFEKAHHIEGLAQYKWEIDRVTDDDIKKNIVVPNYKKGDFTLPQTYGALKNTGKTVEGYAQAEYISVPNAATRLFPDGALLWNPALSYQSVRVKVIVTKKGNSEPISVKTFTIPSHEYSFMSQPILTRVQYHGKQLICAGVYHTRIGDSYFKLPSFKPEELWHFPSYVKAKYIEEEPKIYHKNDPEYEQCKQSVIKAYPTKSDKYGIALYYEKGDLDRLSILAADIKFKKNVQGNFPIIFQYQGNIPRPDKGIELDVYSPAYRILSAGLFDPMWTDMANMTDRDIPPIIDWAKSELACDTIPPARKGACGGRLLGEPESFIIKPYSEGHVITWARYLKLRHMTKHESWKDLEKNLVFHPKGFVKLWYVFQNYYYPSYPIVVTHTIKRGKTRITVSYRNIPLSGGVDLWTY